MRVRDSSELTRVSALELSGLIEKLAEFVEKFAVFPE